MCDSFASSCMCIGLCANVNCVMSKKITENGEGIPVLLTLIDRVSEFIHVFQED
jgi:hypothetical protein